MLGITARVEMVQKSVLSGTDMILRNVLDESESILSALGYFL